MNTIEGKLASLQETQQGIMFDSAGPKTEKLVEEMNQVTTQCATDAAVVQVELGHLHEKISMPSK